MGPQQTSSRQPGSLPHFLIVPGLNNSGHSHWQTLWQKLLRNASRAELGDWARPDREEWVQKLDEAIRGIPGPIILCAHSLGCHAVAWWAATRAKADGWPVVGALLIAPPDCDRSDGLSNASGFSPSPIAKLPFPTILAASSDDRYSSLDQNRRLAKDWGATFVDSGALGHINADSGLGMWPGGLALLGRLLTLAGLGRSHKRPALPMAA
jgi:uncharacterized protein